MLSWLKVDVKISPFLELTAYNKLAMVMGGVYEGVEVGK